MRIAFGILFFFSVLFPKAQNLVPNPSFEDYTACPIGNKFDMLTYWCGLAGGEDAFNACNNPLNPGADGVPYSQIAGFQYARTGVGIGSVFIYGPPVSGYPPNRREYLKVPLISTLVQGKKYCGTMYVNVYNESMVCTDRAGIYITNSNLNCNQAFPMPQYIAPLNVTPQIQNPPGQLITDTLNWIEVSGTFTAVGNEQYLYIGNFYDDANTYTVTTYPTSLMNWNYLMIDDVSLEEVHDAQCTNDTTLCNPDSILLGNNVSEAAEYAWSPSTGLSCTTCPNPKAYINQTITYTLTKKQCKVTSMDYVTVTLKNDCGLVDIPNVFTPNEDGINDAFRVTLPVGYSFADFVVYNRWGNVIFKPESISKTTLFWDGHTTS
ncbi:MAG: gliding motility-associated C-terminal domain-containing protein, partial [Bacteroidetes bacterium]|nr:gliding motility-associated C-terminal domain-containing protein [Bacteroidota bacterium]